MSPAVWKAIGCLLLVALAVAYVVVKGNNDIRKSGGGRK
jgi:hypothetical protein